MKDNFEYKIISWQLFSFNILKMLFRCLLSSIISVEKLDVSDFFLRHWFFFLVIWFSEDLWCTQAWFSLFIFNLGFPEFPECLNWHILSVLENFLKSDFPHFLSFSFCDFYYMYVRTLDRSQSLCTWKFWWWTLEPRALILWSPEIKFYFCAASAFQEDALAHSVTSSCLSSRL